MVQNCRFCKWFFFKKCYLNWTLFVKCFLFQEKLQLLSRPKVWELDFNFLFGKKFRSSDHWNIDSWKQKLTFVYDFLNFLLKFVFFNKATKIDEIFTVDVKLIYITSNWRWRFRQFLWPSQKTWTFKIEGSNYCNTLTPRKK